MLGDVVEGFLITVDACVRVVEPAEESAVGDVVPDVCALHCVVSPGGVTGI